MTIEEKAKAYDEALERAKVWREKSGMPTDRQGILDDIFPELRESEDERIRGKIIATIHLYYGEPLEDEAKEMIAWLEKQKREEPSIADIVDEHFWEMLSDEKQGEQKPVEWSEEDEKRLSDIIVFVSGYATKEVNKEWVDFLKSLRPYSSYHEGFKKGFAKAKEMHYDHWKPSEEQMQALDGICSYIRNKADWEISQDMVSDLYKLSEQLKKLREE